MKTQFYFSKKSNHLIYVDTSFFCTPQINSQQSFTHITGLNASIYQSRYYAASPTKHNTELLFLSLSNKAEILPVGNTGEEYFTDSFFLPSRLVECHLPSIPKKIFSPNQYYNAFTQ